MSLLKNEEDGKQSFDCYMKLAVFLRGEQVPETVILTLWSLQSRLQENQLRQLLNRLRNRALLKLEGKPKLRKVSLHDLHGDFIQAKIEDLAYLQGILGRAQRFLWAKNDYLAKRSKTKYLANLHGALGSELLGWWQKNKSERLPLP